MELLYLGTAACEGIPSMYCKCPVCEYARQKKGKELRSRSSFVLDRKLYIDFSPDTYLNCIKNNLIFGESEHLLITHSDSDHYYPQDLVMRYFNDTHDGIPQILNIYGNENIAKFFKEVSFYSDDTLNFVKLVVLKRNTTVDVGGYLVTPFYSEHLLSEDSFVYLIQKDNKAYLHLVDSPVPNKTVFDYLTNNKVKLDCVSMDCTFGSMKEEHGGHMNLWQNIEVKNRLTALGAADDKTIFVATHISHFGGTDTHKSLSGIAKKHGIILAFDGLKVRF